MKTNNIRQNKNRQHLTGTSHQPRLTIYHSLKHLYAQIIDDSIGKTLVASSDYNINNKNNLKPIEISFKVGENIGKIAISKKITRVVFDRNGYRYHGHIKAVAEGARKAGLKF